MKIGVFITRGPQDWQILQQVNGSTDILLEGYVLLDTNCKALAVNAFVFDAQDGKVVADKTISEVDAQLKWGLTIKNVPLGGLYLIRTEVAVENENGDSYSIWGDMIHHIGVGDVFVIAGQSNSAGYGRGVAYDAPELGVHVLKNNGKWDIAAHPLNDPTDSIHEVNRETGLIATSPWLTFAKRLKKELGYPIGMIQASLGGSCITLWHPKLDGRLYRNMIDVIHATGSGVTGVLWYQGCSDTNPADAPLYLERFTQIVQSFRNDISSDAWFITVQLNRATFYSIDESWGMLKEAQRQAANLIKNVIVIPSIDCTLSDNIHNDSLSNVRLGERAALVCSYKMYNRGRAHGVPDVQNARRTESGLELTFSNAAQALVFIGEVKDITLEVEDQNGAVEVLNFYAPTGTGTLDIRLSRALIGEAYVSMGHTSNPKPQVFMNDTCIPALSFYKVPIQ